MAPTRTLVVSARAETVTDAAAYGLSPLTLSDRLGRVLRNAWTQRILSVIVVFALWQIFGNQFTTSVPSLIFQQAFSQSFVTDVLPAFGQTLATFGTGFAICIVAGVPIGLAMARVRVVRVILEPYVNTFYSLPMVSLLPVLLLAFGIGFPLRVAATVLFGIFAVIVNTYIGASSIDPALEDTAKVFVASPAKRLTTVILPASLNYIFAGIRIAFGHGMIGAVVIELEASAIGVGFQLSTDASELRFDKFWVVVFVLGIFSIIAGVIMRRTERTFTEPWTRPAWMRRHPEATSVATTGSALTRRTAAPAPSRTSAASGTDESAFAPVARGFEAFGHAINRLIRKRWGAVTLQIVVLLILLTAWQIGSTSVSRAVLPSPISVAIEIYNQTIVTGSIFAPLWQSVSLLIVGFVVAVVLGVIIGLAMGQFRWINNVLDPYVSFLYALPHAVFIPILVVWLGFGFPFGLGYVVISATFPVLINAMQSVRTMKQEYPDLARSFNASRWQTTRTIIWPHSIPYIATGIRLAFSVSWIAVIVSEVLSSEQGLGGLITNYGNQYRTADMFVPVIFITVISVVILQLSTRLQPRLAPWAPSSLGK
jgi:ABC-type nitrate/sulfonate/bicarbonate transport system permease component